MTLGTPAAPTLDTDRLSRRVAERLGERRTDELFTPFREPRDVWEMRREDWPAAQASARSASFSSPSS